MACIDLNTVETHWELQPSSDLASLDSFVGRASMSRTFFLFGLEPTKAKRLKLQWCGVLEIAALDVYGYVRVIG